MSKKSDDSTGNILKRLAVYLPSFFALHYVIAIILYASLGIYSNWGWYEFALVPFNHAACLRALPNMNASSGFPLGSGANMTDYPGPYVTHGLSLVVFLTLLLSYVLASLLIFFGVRSVRMSWDYAVTGALLHVVISIAGENFCNETEHLFIMGCSDGCSFATTRC
uniref:Uncharacterized protein n=1 Tax=Palpitomonas bilix TaxID=652834 RepID=A0A7S3GLW7_9EUKA